MSNNNLNLQNDEVIDVSVDNSAITNVEVELSLSGSPAEVIRNEVADEPAPQVPAQEPSAAEVVDVPAPQESEPTPSSEQSPKVESTISTPKCDHSVPPDRPKPADIRICGKVVNKCSCTPIEGAQVTLRYNCQCKNTLTTANGNFEFVLPPNARCAGLSICKVGFYTRTICTCIPKHNNQTYCLTPIY